MSYCSLSQKMSIGMAVDSATKRSGGRMKEKEAANARNLTSELRSAKQGLKASVSVRSKENVDPEGSLFRFGAGSLAAKTMGKSSGHVDEQASAPAIASSARALRPRHGLQFVENQAQLKPGEFKKRGADGGSVTEAKKAATNRRSEECMPAKKVQPTDVETRPAVASSVCALQPRHGLQFAENQALLKPGELKTRGADGVSVTEAKKAATDRRSEECAPAEKVQPADVETRPAVASSACALQPRNGLRSAENQAQLKPGGFKKRGADVGSVKEAEKAVTDRISEERVPAEKLQPTDVEMRNKEALRSKLLQILGSNPSASQKMEDSKVPDCERGSPSLHGCLNEQSEAIREAVNPNHSPVLTDKHVVREAEDPVQQEKLSDQHDHVADHPAPQADNTDSPIIFKRRTVFNSLTGVLPLNNNKKQRVHRSPSPQAAGWSIPEKLFPESTPATEKENLCSSDETVAPDEVDADAQESSIEEKDTEDELYTPQRGDSDSIEEDSSAKEVSSEDEAVEKPMRFQNLRRHSQDVGCSDFGPSLPTPTACGNMDDDALMEALDGSSEDGLARMISLLGLALEKVRSKMELATNKKCSDILLSAAEEVRTQLEDVESQIHTDLGKLTSLKTSKRKHVETTLQEQQENLRLLHTKFKEDIQKCVQDCRSAVEGLENEHSELKGAMERQKTSHRKLLLKAGAAVENQLTVAQRRIATVRKLGRQKINQLKVAIGECFKDEMLSQQ